MATNPTKDPLQFLLQMQNDCQHHLDAAITRYTRAKIKHEEKKRTNPKYKRPDLPESNSEIDHLKIKMANINYCIEAVKEKRQREFSESIDKEARQKKLKDHYDKIIEENNKKPKDSKKPKINGKPIIFGRRERD